MKSPPGAKPVPAVANVDSLKDDVVSAALAWREYGNGISVRALESAVDRLLEYRRQGSAAPTARNEQLAFDEPRSVATAPPATAALPKAPPTVAGEFTIYSDGSALNNPGPSGCGWVVVAQGTIVYEGFEAIGHATNQVAEIRAAAHGLNDLPAGSTADVFTDSMYVVQTMKGAFKKKANLTHWAFLDAAVARHKTVRFHHVRGHAGHDMNERADKLANQGAMLSKKGSAAFD
ncbi:MAG: ribonuclease HI [Janthinobacterium lividum]